MGTQPTGSVLSVKNRHLWHCVCAPFLANACMLQLAEDAKSTIPVGASLLQHNDADDLFAGEDTLDEAVRARNQLIAIMCSAGMTLGKWATNSIDLLPEPSSPCLFTSKTVNGGPEGVSTLELCCNPLLDTFSFKDSVAKETRQVTKRCMRSAISRIFYPIGWLALINMSENSSTALAVTTRLG